jgi:hypothetical protein
MHLILEDSVEVEGAILDVDKGFNCEILIGVVLSNENEGLVLKIKSNCMWQRQEEVEGFLEIRRTRGTYWLCRIFY